MVNARNRAVIGAVLLVSGGCSAEVHPVARALQHRGGENVSVGGTGLEPILSGTSIQSLSDNAMYIVEPATEPTGALRDASTPDAAYVLDLVVDDWLLWRYRDDMPFESVAIQRESLSTQWPMGEPVGPIHTMGWQPEQGVWMGEVLIQLPDQSPWDVCVRIVGSDGTHRDGGQLLQGRRGFYPGTAGQTAIRHRMYVQGLDEDLSGYQLVLEDCSTSEVLFSRDVTEWQNVEPLRLPSLSKVWSDPVVANGAWTAPKAGAPGLRRTIDGVVKVEGPPYPRLRKKDAWPLLYVGPLDLTHWDAVNMDTALSPLRRADPWLDGPGWTVLSAGALTTRHGPVAVLMEKDDGYARRVIPEWLPIIERHGVDAVVFSGVPHGQFQAETVEQAEQNARASGLTVIPTLTLEPAYFEYEVGEHVRVGAMVSIRAPVGNATEFWRHVKENVVALSQRTHAILLEINTSNTTASMSQIAEELSVEGVAGILLVGSGDAPAVDIYKGVTHVYGLTEMTMKRRLGTAVRWYFGAQGIERIDLVGIALNDEGQLIRSSQSESHQLFEEISQNSLQYGTYVRAGKQIATVDVRGHRPSTEIPYRILPVPKASDAVGFLESKEIPQRCKGRPVEEAKVKYEHGLRLDSWSLVTSRVENGKPFVVELQWSREDVGTVLPVTSVRFNASLTPQPLRVSYRPCSGSWDLQDLKKYQVINERVKLWPPPDSTPGARDLWLTIQTPSGVLRTEKGARRISLGKIHIEK